MRVLMSALHPEGGIRTFFRYIYSHPVFSGIHFTLVAPDRGLTDYLAEFVPERQFEIIEPLQGKLRIIRQLRGLARTGKYDLIHSHGFSAGMLTELSRTGLYLPHLMTAHDVFLPVQFAGVQGMLRQWLMARLFVRMTTIHTVSEDARLNLLTFFPAIQAAQVKGILHGIDTHYFRDSTASDLRQKLGLGSDVPLLGFFGRFMGQKGFRLLVDAMETIVTENLLPVAPHVTTFGWNGYIREDYEYLRTKGLGEYFHQQEQTHEVGSMLKAVDLVVMPSRWEACGLLAMEALAAGVPIVGSDCIGLREVLAGSPARLFRTGDPAELREAIIVELSTREDRKRAFMQYQSQAVNRFHIDRPARALANLYSELANQR